jgi:hypothetical protein
MKSKPSTGKGPLKNVLIPLDGGLDVYSNPKNLGIDKATRTENFIPENSQLVPAPQATPGTAFLAGNRLGSPVSLAQDLAVTITPAAAAGTRPTFSVGNTSADVCSVKILPIGSELLNGNEILYSPPVGTGPGYAYAVFDGTNYIVRAFTADNITGASTPFVQISSAAGQPKIQAVGGFIGTLRGTTLIITDFAANIIQTISNVTGFDMTFINNTGGVAVAYVLSGGTVEIRESTTFAAVTVASALLTNLAPISCSSFRNASGVFTRLAIVCNTSTAGTIRGIIRDSFGFTPQTLALPGVTTTGSVIQLAVGAASAVIIGGPVTTERYTFAATILPPSTFTSTTGHTHRFPYVITGRLNFNTGSFASITLDNPSTILEAGGVSITGRPDSLNGLAVASGVTLTNLENRAVGELLKIKNLITFVETTPSVNQPSSPVGVGLPLGINQVYHGFLRDSIWGPGLDAYHIVPQWGAFQFNAQGVSWRTSIPVPYFIAARNVESKNLTTFGTVTSPLFGVALLVVELSQEADQLPAPIQAGRSLYFANSGVVSATSSEVVESGYLTKPPNLTAVVTAGAGLGSGPYYYVTVLQWTDSAGQVHLSEPSTPFPVTVGAGGNNQVTLALFYKKLTTRQNAKIILYRTELNPGNDLGEVSYFKVTTISNRATRVNGAAPVGSDYFATFIDTLADTALGQGLYTNSGVSGLNFEVPIAPPPFLSTALWDQRLWGVSFIGGYNLDFSWPYEDNDTNALAISFNALNKINVPSEAGTVLAIAPLDGQLIVFGSNSDYAISGKGPARTSSGTSGYTLTGPYPSPGGMVTPNSWIRIPDGILYQSTQGFILLSRAGQYDFIGQPVRDITTNARFSRGTLVPNRNFVYFTRLGNATPGSFALAYNYVEKKWFTLVNEAGGLRPGYIVKNNSGIPTVQNLSGAILTDGLAVTSVVETGWIQPGGITGYGEITDMQVLGEWLGPHILQVEEAYDYGAYGAPRQQVIPANVPDYQYRFSPVQTQVRAIRYRITLIPTSTTATAKIFGIMVNVGTDAELSRLANSRNT